MEKEYYPQVRETVYRSTLPNGLQIAVVPKPGFSKKYAYFAANFGSIHRSFQLDGTCCTVPMGTAHFLEHKLFDMPDYNVSERLSMLGASPNAFTGYDMTAYYFSCTEHFSECLKILLEFVSTPYFTEETVAKEQGIIGQEIDMCLDEPDTCIFEMLMENMYAAHPVRERILGTKQSISEITPELLSSCHKAFYRPDNMMLCVVGDVQPDAVWKIAEEVLPDVFEGKMQTKRFWQEEMTCLRSLSEAKMQVAKTTFLLGFKCEPLPSGMEGLRQEAIGGLAAEILFGETSELFLRLYRQGIIDYSFGGGFDDSASMAFLSVGGDSETPEAVRDAIVQSAQKFAKDGIDEQTLTRLKRASIGRRIRGLDNYASIGPQICMCSFAGTDFFRAIEVYEDITGRDIQEFIGRVITPERMTMAIIRPAQ